MIDIAIILIYSITSIIWIFKKIHFEGLSFQTNIKVIILKVIISFIFPTSIYIYFSFASMPILRLFLGSICIGVSGIIFWIFYY